MSERTKLFILLALLGVLVLVAAFAAFGPNGLMRKRVRTAESKEVEEEVVVNALPPAETFGELAEWLAPEGEGIQPVAQQAGPVFGLVMQKPEETPAAKPRPGTVDPQVYVIQPPMLQGIFRSEDGRFALIDGERYRVGQTVRNTAFKVVDIGTSTVKLRTDRGREISLDLLR